MQKSLRFRNICAFKEVTLVGYQRTSRNISFKQLCPCDYNLIDGDQIKVIVQIVSELSKYFIIIMIHTDT